MTFAGKFKPQSLAPRRVSANARPALDCIEENTPLKSLLEKAENSLRLQRAVAISLNKNGLEKAIDLVTVGGFSEADGRLKLFASNSAVATRLQQKLPSILFGIQEQGWPVQHLLIKQAPGGLKIVDTSPSERPPAPVIFSSKAKESWSKLLKTLEIDSPLRKAVEKLLKNQ
jgi:hypothetical protein